MAKSELNEKENVRTNPDELEEPIEDNHSMLELKRLEKPRTRLNSREQNRELNSHFGQVESDLQRQVQTGDAMIDSEGDSNEESDGASSVSESSSSSEEIGEEMSEERIEDSEPAYASPRPAPEVIATPIRRLSTPLVSELSLTKIMEEFPGLNADKTTLEIDKVSDAIHEPISL